MVSPGGLHFRLDLDWLSKLGQGVGMHGSLQLQASRAITVELLDYGRGSSFTAVSGLSDSLFVAAAGRFYGSLQSSRALLGLRQDESDISTLAEAFRRWKCDVPRHVTGEWMLLFLDLVTREVWIFRDALGIGEAYWSRTRGVVEVANRVDLLNEATVAPDYESLQQYIRFKFELGDRTFFKNVMQVPPGCGVVLSDAASRGFRHYHPPSIDESLRTTADLHEGFRAHFLEAVRRRAEGSPLVRISGGLDSSSIAGAVEKLMRAGQISGSPIGASISFEGLNCDEEAYQALVFRRVSFPCFRLPMGPQLDIDLVAPGAFPGCRSIFVAVGADLNFALARGSTSILCGEGGDIHGWESGALLQKARDGHLVSLMASLLFAEPGEGFRRLRGLRKGIAQEVKARATDRSYVSFGTEGQNALPLSTPYSVATCRSKFQAQLYALFNDQKYQGLLSYSKAYAASAGLEIRYPFMDKNLVDFVLSIPAHLRCTSRYSRGLPRESLRPFMPAAISTRRVKAEFGAAFKIIIRANLPRLRALLMRPKTRISEFLNIAQVVTTLQRLEIDPSLDATTHLHVYRYACVEAWLCARFGS